MSSKRDFYSVLGVERDADETQLKKAFRKLAMEYHPDRNPDPKASDLFREAQEAYEVLTDPERRQIYDQLGHTGLQGRMGGGYSNMDDVFSGFSSIFEDFFGGSSQSSRGRDMRYRLRISFREAALGCTKEIEIPRSETCTPCEGSGAAEGSSAETCKTCKGQGKLRIQQGFFVMTQNCHVCGGEGRVIKKVCKTCKGSGLQEHKVRLEVQVPAGVDSGMRLRMSGEGELDRKSKKRGDLYVELEVEADELFERDGADLYLRVYVPYPIAVLGGDVEIPLLEGTKKIHIAKGLTSPHTLSLKSEGLAQLRGGGRGMLYVECQIETPNELSAKAKELIRELHEELGGNAVSKKSTTKKKKSFFGD
jgi:molecular chaperone DnaJ